jgi:hypothetical protein
MKLIAQLILLTVLLAACAAQPADVPTASPSPSATQTLTPKNTSTALSAGLTPDTLTPDTPTVTPLPTIPTFTPTFDVRTIVTATPAPKAECPQEDSNILVKIFDGPKRVLTIEEQNEVANKTLKLLNQGAPKVSIIREFSNAPTYGKTEITEKDVTNDGIPELIAYIENGFVIYKCNHGDYENILQWLVDASVQYVQIDSIQDMNMDGIPEVIASLTACSGAGCKSIKIFGWDGLEMKNLVIVSSYDPATNTPITYDSMGMDSPKNESIVDVNGDGLLELVLTGGMGICCTSDQIAMRHLVDIYSWNGTAFDIYENGFTEPEYRFQAVQDADRETLHGRWDKAFSLYQDVISSDLDWWSPERKKDIGTKMDAHWVNQPTPDTLILKDETEYPRLAAYAYYRMLILHTFLGETEAAQVKYATLQEKFPAENPGHPYVELATDFWNAYQSSGRMYDACAAAIAYAETHPEILIPLGSDYHGAQSHIYTPADVCPFR